MRTFHVYEDPTLGANAVKIGFCWPAFFFGIIWMAASRLWGWALLWFGLYLLLALLEEGVGDDAGMILVLVGYLVLWLVPGFQGNAWRAKNLLSRGFEFEAAVQAENKDAAIASATRAVQS